MKPPQYRHQNDRLQCNSVHYRGVRIKQVPKGQYLWNHPRELSVIESMTINPLGPKSDQHQFSPNNISRSSRVKVMRITKLITKGRML